MERKGKLIIIEAGDGSGKATQTKALYDHLCREGYRVHRIEFPDYAADSSMLVRMYLRGDFGGHAEDVNAYAASTFFAVDRYASYRMKWKKAYEAGDIILADRYTTSNMVHQAVKLTDRSAGLAQCKPARHVCARQRRANTQADGTKKLGVKRRS